MTRLSAHEGTKVGGGGDKINIKFDILLSSPLTKMLPGVIEREHGDLSPLGR